MEILAVTLPLLGATVVGFFGRYLGDKLSQLITCVLVSVAAFFHFLYFFNF